MRSIRALKFSSEPGGAPEPVSLEVESSAALQAALSQDPLAGYVVSDHDLKLVRRFDDVIVDRGRRHAARQLWRYLVPAKQAPPGKMTVVETNYSEAGRFANALADTFAKARAKGASGRFIVGVDSALLEALRRSNGRQAGRRAPKPGMQASDGGTRAALFDELRRADEVIRACQVALGPPSQNVPTDTESAKRTQRAIHFRLQELDQLCEHPILFHGEETFEAVIRLKATLEAVRDRIRNGARDTGQHTSKELTGEFKGALSAIFKGVKRVTAGA